MMRDRNDTAICICCMENIDPVGIHTGDSIVVAPSQTLTNKEFQMLRDSALKIIRELKIEGGCNVQFALDPLSFKYYPDRGQSARVALLGPWPRRPRDTPSPASARRSPMGLTLDEIRHALRRLPASFEFSTPRLRRYEGDGRVLMSGGRTMEESLLKPYDGGAL